MRNVNKILENILSGFSLNQKRVLSERFGLAGRKRTLQAIGDDLGITRERVRQIEKQAVKTLEPEIKKEFAKLIETAGKILRKKGGVYRDDKFVEDVQKAAGAGQVENIGNKIRFVFLVAGTPKFYKEDDNVYSFWYETEKDKEKLFEYLEKAVSFFRENKEEILENEVYKKKFSMPEFENFVSISKRFGKSVFGDFGLREWPEIEPKFIRDKAHLILKKKKKPLHFSDIAEKIREVGIDGKRVHVQTVHNELIKDDRFVLVGRGIYGLKEHGYEGGTARDVIKKILKEKGPLSAKEVVKLVNEKKILKENTILINLQNSNYFESDNEGKYHVREA